MENIINFKNGYTEVNGLKMYYEVYGTGKPLVLIHGGGSTIETSFGRIIPLLAKTRQIIAMELQAHGHTNDRQTDLSFGQNADDIAVLLNDLKISNADFLGYSNGGHTLIEIALRFPHVINKMILASTFYKRDAAPPQFWEGFDHVTINNMPEVLQKGYLKANNSEEGLINMFNKDVKLLKGFTDWSDAQMRSIKAPALVINATQDVGSVEHAVKMYRMIPNCELVILPGTHGEFLGTAEAISNGTWNQEYSIQIIEEFLDRNQEKTEV
ncbi:alpha/beta fold hydrolase [Mucilaginibacter segetis]|nr:alpha/beta hydrolase [Mucilaginibacter segetis]